MNGENYSYFPFSGAVSELKPFARLVPLYCPTAALPFKPKDFYRAYWISLLFVLHTLSYSSECPGFDHI